jgi:FKBP-type peptidyl-prolyl cis-trans isomerase FkpA
MKKIILVLLVGVFFASCKKDDTTTCSQPTGNPVAPTAEIASVQSYITAAGITNAVQHSSGIFYSINNQGSGAVADQCNFVGVKYTGRLTSGAKFDEATTPQVFALYNLIMGWRIGIPLIQPGGSIRLYIPPSLGYGNRIVGSIPANSILVFDIDLVSVS